MFRKKKKVKKIIKPHPDEIEENNQEDLEERQIKSSEKSPQGSDNDDGKALLQLAKKKNLRTKRPFSSSMKVAVNTKSKLPKKKKKIQQVALSFGQEEEENVFAIKKGLVGKIFTKEDTVENSRNVAVNNGGEYSVEKMVELKAKQNYQLTGGTSVESSEAVFEKEQENDEEFIPLDMMQKKKKIATKRVAFADAVPQTENREMHEEERQSVPKDRMDDQFHVEDTSENEEEHAYNQWELNLMRRGAGKSHSSLPHRNEMDRSSDRTESDLSFLTVEEIEVKINKKIGHLDSLIEKYERDHSFLQTETQQTNNCILEYQTEIESDISPKFEYFQRMRGFVLDLCFCLREKLPLLDEKEHEQLERLGTKQRELRREVDLTIKDEVFDLLGTGDHETHQFDNNGDFAGRDRAYYDKMQRIRRKERWKKRVELYGENFSVLSDTEVVDFKVVQSNRSYDSGIMNDVSEDYSSFNSITSQFLSWKDQYPQLYEDSFCSLSLFDIFSAYIRLNMLNWNPLRHVSGIDSGSPRSYLDNLPNVQLLLEFANVKTSVLNDEISTSDITLVNRILNDVIFSRLGKIIDACYEPFSCCGSSNLMNYISSLSNIYIRNEKAVSQSKNCSKQSINVIQIGEEFLKPIALTLSNKIDSGIMWLTFPEFKIDPNQDISTLVQLVWGCFLSLVKSTLIWIDFFDSMSSSLHEIFEDMLLSKLIDGKLVGILRDLLEDINKCSNCKSSPKLYTVIVSMAVEIINTVPNHLIKRKEKLESFMLFINNLRNNLKRIQLVDEIKALDESLKLLE